MCFPFKKSLLFSYIPATSYCPNLPEKEMQRHCQKGYSYKSSVPERIKREFENYVGVNLILDISWVILQTKGWLFQIKARISC